MKQARKAQAAHHIAYHYIQLAISAHNEQTNDDVRFILLLSFSIEFYRFSCSFAANDASMDRILRSF
jgi:hypothetical protein